jgi:hypothetical protein
MSFDELLAKKLDEAVEEASDFTIQEMEERIKFYKFLYRNNGSKADRILKNETKALELVLKKRNERRKQYGVNDYIKEIKKFSKWFDTIPPWQLVENKVSVIDFMMDIKKYMEELK